MNIEIDAPQHGVIYVYDSVTTVRILTRADRLDAAPVLTEFRLPLADVFPPVSE
jgi:hypothetical protein